MKRQTIMLYYKKIREFTDAFRDYNLSVHAAHVAFFIMVSFFPFILFFFTLLHYTPLTQEGILTLAASVVPETMRDVLGNWISEGYERSSGTLLSITVITTIWSGSKGFMGIIWGLDKIYEAKDKRNWFTSRLFSLFYTICFAVILLISLIVLVYGNRILLAIDSFFSIEAPAFIGIFSLRSILGFGIFFCFFLILYVVIPARKATLKSQVPGALFTSILWILFSYLFSIYIDHFTNFSSIYGSLTYIVLFMLWLYICINILFGGALLNAYLTSTPSK